MADVFISYKQVDKDKVYPLVSWLESKLGIKVWIDRMSVKIEDMFPEHIEKAIRECKVFIFMYSKAHEVISKKDWQYYELYYAFIIDKKIIFIELENCVLNYQFNVDFPYKTVRHADNSQEMDDLINNLREFLLLPEPNLTPSHPPKATDTTNSDSQLQSEGAAATIQQLHQAIDLGLPSGTKWASFNLGATKPEGYGGYYAWGETVEKEEYVWRTYKHCNGFLFPHNLGSNIAGTSFDVAHVIWGGNWRMPTLEQFKELLDNCNYEWVIQNGVYGGKFESKINGNSIFLPAAGSRFLGEPYNIGNVNSGGGYWSSTWDPLSPDCAYRFNICSDFARWSSDCRIFGLSIRPVSKK